jgi:hypothetical protein
MYRKNAGVVRRATHCDASNGLNVTFDRDRRGVPLNDIDDVEFGAFPAIRDDMPAIGRLDGMNQRGVIIEERVRFPQERPQFDGSLRGNKRVAIERVQPSIGRDHVDRATIWIEQGFDRQGVESLR